jgi:hypothetical protein
MSNTTTTIPVARTLRSRSPTATTTTTAPTVAPLRPPPPPPQLRKRTINTAE